MKVAWWQTQHRRHTLTGTVAWTISSRAIRVALLICRRNQKLVISLKRLLNRSDMVGRMTEVDSKVRAMSTIDYTRPLFLGKRLRNLLVAPPTIARENLYVALIPTIRCRVVNIRWCLTRKKWWALAWDHPQSKVITTQKTRCMFEETTTQPASRLSVRQTAMPGPSTTESFSTKEAWEERKKREKLYRWQSPSKMSRSSMATLSNPRSIEFQGIWKESTMKKQRTF